MNLLTATIIAIWCFFLLGFALALIPQNTSPIWVGIITILALVPAFCFGIIVGLKVQNII